MPNGTDASLNRFHGLFQQQHSLKTTRAVNHFLLQQSTTTTSTTA